MIKEIFTTGHATAVAGAVGAVAVLLDVRLALILRCAALVVVKFRAALFLLAWGVAVVAVDPVAVLEEPTRIGGVDDLLPNTRKPRKRLRC